MNTKQIIIDLLVLAVGVFSALLAFYYVVKNEIEKYFHFRTSALNKETSMHLLPLRLQAHERLIIFVDRINPANLLVRVHQQGIEVPTLHAGILNEIRSEYQHNITQQLYINSSSWKVVRKLKDDTIAMMNNAVQGLPSDANGVELSRAVLQHMATISENPYDLTIELIKKDIQQLV